MAENSVHPQKRPKYVVEVRNNGETWRRRSFLYALDDAVREAAKAREERGYMMWRLYPHVRITVDGLVIAAWRLDRVIIAPPVNEQGVLQVVAEAGAQ